ncbi:hypothetical protein VNTUMSATTG_18640 [Vibrio nigripulchritudo]|uniref:hypothetical protein n=1 Tax=Vibrio nigripulchritudo TaxID=28173 RepID=UPI00190B5F21|nr:hypothetical protein [Vibrio nigripulchritudo]BCL69927.1 hypothetical protein VNTUMSATTG_18640 [Vibrio nigripulchritudo]
MEILKTTLILTILWCFNVSAYSSELECVPQNKSEYPLVANALKIINSSSPLILCTIGSTNIWFSTGSKKQAIQTDSNIIVINGGDIHISDLQDNVVSTVTKNNQLTSVSYSCIASQCKNVTDYNSDGVIDYQVLNSEPKVVQLFVENQWYIVAKPAPELSVQDNDKERLVKATNVGFEFVR